MSLTRQRRLWAAVRSLDPGLLVAAAIGAFLRFSRLGEYDNSYYTATVTSMLQNAHNFFFASFDPAGMVMVDKPPVSFWVQAFPAAILGISSWSVTLPQAIIGTLAIVILYWTIRPVFGRLAAIVAALVLAVVPASVVIDSRNEPDSLLSVTLLLAAISIIRAVQTGKWRWLIAFGVLMGIGFNTKMLIAFIPLPAFLLYYILAAKHPLHQLVKRTITTIAVLLLVSVSWVTMIWLTPVENRPYVGSTPDNSIWTLVLRYNGINRFTEFIGTRPRAPLQRLDRLPDQTGQPSSIAAVPLGPGGPQGIGPPAMNSEVPNIGLLGLFSNPLANQLGWLLPVGLISLMLVFVPVFPEEVYRRPSKLPTVLRASPTASQAILWGGWLATGLVVFGIANSTTTHPYYLVGVAVPLAATIGAGAPTLLNTFRRGSALSWLVVVVLIVSAMYQVYGSHTSAGDWIIAIVVAGVLFAVLVMAIGLWRNLQTEPLAGGALAIGASALLVIPLFGSLTAGGRIADPNLNLPPPISASQPDQRELQTTVLSRVLMEEGRATSSITLGTLNAREAAPFIVAGIPSIAIGGFSGNDPVFTIDSFRDMAAVRGPRYFLMPARGTGDTRQGRPQEPILDYIRSHWKDSSRSVGLPPRTLYMNPRWSSDS
jgi:4-amino-4-deoxy-L-arabinose transferase-like glycosyltransferase